jgi:ABC-type ATPase involved in cell division
VLENVMLPLIYGKKKNHEKLAKDVLESVGLSHRLNFYTNQISGGEKQRVAIARALVGDPSVIFADEPTGNLDPFVAMDIVKLLNDINKTGTTLIMATHNFDIVKKFADKRILQLKDRKVFDVRLKA